MINTLRLLLYNILVKSGRRVTRISRSLIWSKTMTELIFNHCGEFWWSPEGPVSQIHSPHLHAGAPGIFYSLFRWDSGVQKAMGSYCIYSSLVKLHSWFLSLQWKTCLWAELKPWCLSFQWKTCPWAEHSGRGGGGGDDANPVSQMRMKEYKICIRY